MRDYAEGCLWTALHLERATPKVGRAGDIAKRLSLVDHRPGRRASLVGRADIDVALFIKPEVFPAEGPVLALRLVDDRNVRRDALVLGQLVEVWA